MAIPEYTLIYDPWEILGFKYERVRAIQGDDILLTASVHLYLRHSKADRDRLHKITAKIRNKRLKTVKADGYQIYVEAKQWDKDILSDDDVVEILEQIVPFFLKRWKPLVYHLSDYKDITDEEYRLTYGERDFKDKRETKRQIIIGSAVLAVILALMVSGYFIGFFGIIMLFAYADDLFARR